MSFDLVTTLQDLDSLDADELLEGYRDWRRGDPEPGPNRGRSYWHGWVNASCDHGERPITAAQRQLAREWVARERERNWPSSKFG